MYFESFTSNCTAYIAPDTVGLTTTDQMLIAIALSSIAAIVLGLLVLMVKLYYVGKREMYDSVGRGPEEDAVDD